MADRIDTYQEITARILQALEQGVPPWRRPWTTSAPMNVRTERPYRGINTLLLALENRADPRWGTFRAWKESGSNVRKGEKGTRIVLWKTATSRTRVDEEGNPAEYAFMRTYVVFNALQCDNVPPLETDGIPFEPIDAAYQLIEAMPNAPLIESGSDSAYYLPSADSVTLPPAESFRSPEAYYLCAFHELAHSVGAPNRLGGAEFGSNFGSDPYAREELVAELTAAMLAGSCGLAFELESSAAYLEGWRAQLSRDNRLIVSAAGEAQRRADYIRGISWDHIPTRKEGKRELATV